LGFLKFLRRDKSKELDLESMEHLDAPPIHPGIEEKGMEKFPEIPKSEKSYPEGKEKLVPDLKLPSVHESPKPDWKEPGVELPGTTPAKEIEPYESSIVVEEKHRETSGPIFVKVNEFRGILSEISIIKRDLKTADQSLLKLNEIEANRDKILAKWRDIMVELQKKVIFIDKKLFKK
jgi:hypothetical protein